MMRNWKVLALPAVLAAALTATPSAANADEAGKAEKNRVLEKLNKAGLNEALKEVGDELLYIKGESLVIKQAVKAIKENVEKVQRDLEQLSADLGEGKGRPPAGPQAGSPPADKATLEDIKNRLAKIEQDLAKLTTTRTAFSPAPSGRLQLVNHYTEDLLFIVNGRAYRVAPGATQTLEQVPAGVFRYEVVSPMWGVRAVNNPVLAAGETFTITAR
jgi:hypothetical protein